MHHLSKKIILLLLVCCPMYVYAFGTRSSEKFHKYDYDEEDAWLDNKIAEKKSSIFERFKNGAISFVTAPFRFVYKISARILSFIGYLLTVIFFIKTIQNANDKTFNFNNLPHDTKEAIIVSHTNLGDMGADVDYRRLINILQAEKERVEQRIAFLKRREERHNVPPFF